MNHFIKKWELKFRSNFSTEQHLNYKMSSLFGDMLVKMRSNNCKILIYDEKTKETDLKCKAKNRILHKTNPQEISKRVISVSF